MSGDMRDLLSESLKVVRSHHGQNQAQIIVLVSRFDKSFADDIVSALVASGGIVRHEKFTRADGINVNDDGFVIKSICKDGSMFEHGQYYSVIHEFIDRN